MGLASDRTSIRRSEIDRCCFTDAFLMIRARVTGNSEVGPGLSGYR